uniref:Splicing factor 3A subunit 1 conserved domain-containing protein n=1 Tax=Pyrodinium bahamense TaxID=73915 RepID=A0A7S0FYU8_9DINO|mmetsp:Transcript_7282/g.20160  ORF Transcript_7282/g.20160 Transcript_7282/m.20160 type:complete len:214 (+) Transcript_7282:171-812(+)
MVIPEEECLEAVLELSAPVRDPDMKIRKDYVRRKKVAPKRLMQRCPITGQLLPVEEMSGHIRGLLLERRWKQQRERAREEAIPVGDIEASLAGFAARRPDLLGSAEAQLEAAVAADSAGGAGAAVPVAVPVEAAHVSNSTVGASSSGLPASTQAVALMPAGALFAPLAAPDGRPGTPALEAGLPGCTYAGAAAGGSTLELRAPAAAGGCGGRP